MSGLSDEKDEEGSPLPPPGDDQLQRQQGRLQHGHAQGPGDHRQPQASDPLARPLRPDSPADRRAEQVDPDRRAGDRVAADQQVHLRGPQGARQGREGGRQGLLREHRGGHPGQRRQADRAEDAPGRQGRSPDGERPRGRRRPPADPGQDAGQDQDGRGHHAGPGDAPPRPSRSPSDSHSPASRDSRAVGKGETSLGESPP